MTGLADAVSLALGERVHLGEALGGGSICITRRATSACGVEFVVKHHPDPPAGMFATEAAGLAWLAEAPDGPRVPAVLGVSDTPPAFIAMEYVAGGGVPDDEAIGSAIAGLHRFGAPSFGLDRAGVLATIALDNTPTEDWPQFLARRRILPLTELAERRGRLPRDLASACRILADRCDRLCGPAEPPARLHGDLWSGNMLVDADGGPVLIDPAVYGGHREMDLAMMGLFGGFGARVFSAYAEAYPLADGWRDRIALCQVVPLLVHVVLFGDAYVSRLRDAVSRYVPVR